MEEKPAYADIPQTRIVTDMSILWDDGCNADKVDRISVFIFNADSLGRLDAYQEFENADDGDIRIGSTGGRKKIFVCANMTVPEEELRKISTEDDLEGCFCMLEDTRRSSPLMLGSAESDTGSGCRPVIHMKPMTSEIVLNSVSCSFAGTPYEGEVISDARVYLINVNAQCCLTEPSEKISRLINIGMLNSSDVRNFVEPDIIVQELEDDIGETPAEHAVSLLCFHNFCEDETPGSPFTRLVIEGRIQGEKYYWPLTINRTEDGEGVRSNSRHVFDLKIRRKGSLDPDSELTIEECGMMMEVKKWTEKEGYVVSF